MQVSVNLENLRADLESARATGDFEVHDFAADDRYWLRANSLAQIALNPMKLINQPIPTSGLAFGDTVIVPSVIPPFPPKLVHFGSEVTVNAAIGLIYNDEEYEPGDLAFYHNVDPKRVKDPVLGDLLAEYTSVEVPLALFGLAENFDGHWRPEDGQHEWFKHELYQFYPDHRELLLPNSTLILGEDSQANIRDYFEIDRASWEATASLDDEPIDYTYKI